MFLEIKPRPKGTAAFRVACRSGSVKCALLLADHKTTNVHVSSREGESAFYLACREGGHEVVKALLDHPTFGMSTRKTITRKLFEETIERRRRKKRRKRRKRRKKRKAMMTMITKKTERIEPRI